MLHPRDELIVDASEWPLLYVHWPSRSRAGDVETLSRRMRELVGRREPHVVLVDGIGSEIPNAVQRRQFAELVKELDPISSRYCLGTAHVVASPLARGVVTALQWVLPQSYPTRVFATEPEARAWLTSRLAAAPR